MSSLPTIDLLEMTHTFPCAYVIKVIGKADADFVARVVAAARAELLMEGELPFRVREAVGGRHLSVTLEPVMASAQHVIDVYRRLSSLDGVIMLF